MVKYGTLQDGVLTYAEYQHGALVTAQGLVFGGKPTDYGYMEVQGIAEDGTDEVVDGVIRHYTGAAVEYTLTYEERVVQYIRERYTMDDELAILRQRDTKTDEYSEYYDYCEECKSKAKEESV